jgi:hypothetical protein
MQIVWGLFSGAFFTITLDNFGALVSAAKRLCKAYSSVA